MAGVSLPIVGACIGTITFCQAFRVSRHVILSGVGKRREAIDDPNDLVRKGFLVEPIW